MVHLLWRELENLKYDWISFEDLNLTEGNQKRFLSAADYCINCWDKKWSFVMYSFFSWISFTKLCSSVAIQHFILSYIGVFPLVFLLICCLLGTWHEVWRSFHFKLSPKIFILALVAIVEECWHPTKVAGTIKLIEHELLQLQSVAWKGEYGSLNSLETSIRGFLSFQIGNQGGFPLPYYFLAYDRLKQICEAIIRIACFPTEAFIKWMFQDSLLVLTISFMGKLFCYMEEIWDLLYLQ